MSTRSEPKGPYKLYMRVGGGKGVTYEVTKNGSSATEFVGMTRDGREVLFTTPASLEAADVDTSVDLYVWREATDTVTRISKAPVEEGLGKEGNKDACGATWTTKCDVRAVDPERRWPLTMEVPFANPGSPVHERAGRRRRLRGWQRRRLLLLAGAARPDDFGIPGERNLYLYRNGEIQLVRSSTPAPRSNRMQISADGSHAALLTDSQLTSYDNDGFSQIYTYDADSGALRCASCPRADSRPAPTS